MEHGDITSAGIDSTDLYSRVKLRALNKKVRYVAYDVFAAEDGKSATARSRKSSSGISRGIFSENVAADLETLNRRNALAVEDSRLGILTEVTLKKTNAFYKRGSENKQMNHQLADVEDFDKLDILLDEGTAIEMLDALRRERPQNSSNNKLDIGDLVWGRVKSHPWWPGQIFDETLASPSVHSYKREGGVLVAFYGDYTYAWLGPQEIIPFDMNYAENLKQTNDQLFFMAVKEAIAEIKRRVALGMVCHCQNHSKLQHMRMEGNSVKQIQKAREHFRPEEIIYFLKHLALSLRKNVKQNPHWIKNVANILAYHKAVVKNFDETYAQDFNAQHKSLECLTGIMKENQKASRDAESQVKTKSLTKLTEDYDLQKKDELNVSHGCLSRKHFEDHEFLVKSEESKYFRQEGPHDLHIFSAKRRYVESEIYPRSPVTRPDRAENLGDIPRDSREHSSSAIPSPEVEMICHRVKISPSKMFPVDTCPDDASGNFCCSSKALQEQFRPNDLTNAENKRSISGFLEDVGMERPVRLNKMKSLARFAANQKLQGESQTGIKSGSSIQPQKNSRIKHKSIRRDVKERMITIKFPPQSILPSVSEVKAKFACFGPLDEYSIRFIWKSSEYQVVFLQRNHAEAAYHHAIQNGTLFSTSEVRYYQQASDHDLNESGNSLGLVENQKEIQPVTSLNSTEFSGEPVSASFQPSLLLPEKIQLKSSLKKLSAEGSDCPSIIESHSSETITGNSKIPKHTVPLSLPFNFPLSSTTTCTINKQSGIDQSVEAFNMEYHQGEATKNSNSQNTPIAKKLSADDSDYPSINESQSLENITDDSEIPRNSVPLLLPSKFPPSSIITCMTSEQLGTDQFVGAINMKNRQIEATKNNDSQNTTIASSIDISHQFIDLLTRCSSLLGELKSSFDHMF